MLFFAERRRAAALARELGMTREELGAMPRARVERLLAVQDGWREAMTDEG